MAIRGTYATTPGGGSYHHLSVWGTLRWMFVLLMLFFFLFPLYWMISTAVKPTGELFTMPPHWVPSAPTLSNFEVALTRYNGAAAFRNSLVAAGMSTVLALAVGTAAAYSMARFRTGGRTLSFWLLSQRIMPPVVLIVPVYVMFSAIGWTDTLQSLILLYAVGNLPFVVWMLRSYFLEIPTEIEDSALVDGATRFTAIVRVTLPLAAPGLAATAIFAFIFSWTEFLFAVILTRNTAITLPVVISGFYSTQADAFGPAAALSVLAAVPMFCLAVMVQHHFVRGLTMGAVKG